MIKKPILPTPNPLDNYQSIGPTPPVLFMATLYLVLDNGLQIFLSSPYQKQLSFAEKKGASAFGHLMKAAWQEGISNTRQCHLYAGLQHQANKIKYYTPVQTSISCPRWCA